jgi:hypothetical protein
MPNFKRPETEYFPVVLYGLIDTLDYNSHLAKSGGVKNCVLSTGLLLTHKLPPFLSW